MKEMLGRLKVVSPRKYGSEELRARPNPLNELVSNKRRIKSLSSEKRVMERLSADQKVTSILQKYAKARIYQGWMEQSQRENESHILIIAEFEILYSISEGRTNKEIADGRQSSISTIKNVTSSIYRKMEVKTKTQAVLKAVNNQYLK